jgi:hypothetical protein
MVEQELPKLTTRVRFPSPAPLVTQLTKSLPRCSSEGETTMNDTGGWLWVAIGLLGVGGLAAAIAYGNALWSQRRKDWATKREQNETIRDNYRHGG